MSDRPFISVVSPVYRAEKLVSKLVERNYIVLRQLCGDNFEIILVEDGSPDNSWQAVQDQCNQKKNVTGVRLSRNFGQHYAISMGLEYARGEWVVVMDCDLQDQPEEIPKLLGMALQGFDVVLARRYERQDGILKKLGSRSYYKVLNYLTGAGFDPAVANFGIYNHKVISNIVALRENIRYFPAMVKWVGFKSTSVDVEHASRGEGKSNYNFNRLMRLGLDIILAYSEKPIWLTLKFGLLISLMAIMFALYTLVRYFLGQIIVPGYTSLIFSVWFFSGLIIITLGAVGLYVGKTFENTKRRPYAIASQVSKGVESIK